MIGMIGDLYPGVYAMRTATRCVLAAAMLVLLVQLLHPGPARGGEKEETSLTKVGDYAPPFELRVLNGRTMNTDTISGNVVLLNFFTTWFGPCVAEMPHLQKLHERFKDKRLVVVSVGREHSEAEVKTFAEKHKLTYRFAADPKREAYEQFARKYIPRNYVIGPGGKIEYQSVGFNEAEFERMVKAIEKALRDAEPEEPPAE